MGVPWLVMTTRVPALACLVRAAQVRLDPQEAVFSFGSRAVFRMDIPPR